MIYLPLPPPHHHPRCFPTSAPLWARSDLLFRRAFVCPVYFQAVWSLFPWYAIVFPMSAYFRLCFVCFSVSRRLLFARAPGGPVYSKAGPVYFRIGHAGFSRGALYFGSGPVYFSAVSSEVRFIPEGRYDRNSVV